MMDLEGGVYANRAKVRWVFEEFAFSFLGCFRRMPP